VKLLLFGRNGQLGRELEKGLLPLGEVKCLGQEDLDLCDIQALQKFLHDLRPDLIVNASAYTAVDRAESEEDKAMKVNALAPGVMAEAARRSGAVFIHYSTDYVFDGRKTSPYTEDDTTNPLNVYGKSKLAGEKNIMQAGDAYLILRTSWVYSMQGNSFVRKVLEWARKSDRLKIVDDQVSNPTWAAALAETTCMILSQNMKHLPERIREGTGLYHLAGSGYTSRFEWAGEIIANASTRTENLARTIEPVSSVEFPTPARRPLFTALDCSKFEAAFGLRLPDWRESLRAAMTE